MARWEPDARGRLHEAALELFNERGYARTTVGDIAARAGLTERTFFRHFADKREVLFGGGSELQAAFATAIAAAPHGALPLEAVAAGLDALGAVFPVPKERARARQAVISANGELQERELIKLASFGAAAAEALRGRGVPEPTASLVAEVGTSIFKVGFERWLAAPGPEGLGSHLREGLAALRAGVGGPA